MIFAFLLISKCIHKQPDSRTAGLIGIVRYFNKKSTIQVGGSPFKYHPGDVEV